MYTRDAMRWLAAAAAFLALTASAESAAAQSPVKGVVQEEFAFTCGLCENADVFACYSELARGGGVTSRKCSTVMSPPLRWQVGFGRLWTNSTLAVQPNRPAGVDDGFDPYLLGKFLEGKLITAPGADDGIPSYSFLSGLSPLSRTRVLSMLSEFEFQLHIDYLPVTEDKVLVFQLCNVAGTAQCGGRTANLHANEMTYGAKEYKEPSWSFIVHRYTGRWSEKTKTWEPGEWGPAGTIEVGFKEPFQVLGKAGDYYFVTDSGKLYRAPQPDKGNDRKMESVWDDAKQPVVAFITDAVADRTFLFCKPNKEGKGVYFEMSDKPDPQPYDAGKIPEAKPDDPLPAVLAYARILVADKKIKEKE